jgi:hypothetical protein
MLAMKMPTNSETFRKLHQNFLRLPISVIGRFSPVVTSHWTVGKSAFLIPISESGVLT